MRTDIKKDRKDLYLPGRADFTEVDVPAMTYLAIDGHGDPNTSPATKAALSALVHRPSRGPTTKSSPVRFFSTARIAYAPA